MLKLRSCLVIIPLLSFTCALQSPAQDAFKGANHAIDLLTDKPDGQKQKPADPAKALAEDLKNFRVRSAAMDPAAAAAEWMKLLDRYLDLKPTREHGPGELNLPGVVGAIPPPPAWPEIGQLISVRGQPKGKTYGRDMGLLLFAHTLTGDGDARDRVVGQLDSFFKTNDVKTLGMLAYAARNLFETLGRLGDKSLQLDQFVKALEAAEAPGAQHNYINVPDLVPLVGEEKAIEYLKRLFATSAELQMYNAKSTAALARRVIVENIDKVTKPHWDLVNTPDAVALYEAMDKKWPPQKAAAKTGLDALRHSGSNDYERNRARAYYLIGLILANRTADATALVKELGPRRRSTS